MTQASAELPRGMAQTTGADAAALRAEGEARYRAGAYAEALASLQAAARLAPNDAGLLNSLGAALRACGRRDEAITTLQRAVELAPHSDEALNNLGNGLKQAGRIDEAFTCYRRAMELNPANEHALTNMAGLLSDLGQQESAIQLYRGALEVAPDCHEARFGLALSLLVSGELAAGWPLYEARWQRGAQRRRDLPQPQWQGEDPAGKTILLHYEQGYGDTLQFLRFLPLLADRGATPLLLVQPPLLSLVAASLPGVAVADRVEALLAFDLHCPLLSLPGLFGTTLETLPAAVPYLRPPAERATAWQGRIAEGDAKVGLVWAGNPANPNDANRSLPPELMRAWFDLPGISWYGLQLGLEDNPLPALAPGSVDLAPEIRDFADTAAAMQQLDLVISVDTAAAHLAGALNRPTWLLLPFAPDWRWLLSRRDSPWYPSLSLFRQPTPGDWPAVADEVAAALRAALGI